MKATDPAGETSGTHPADRVIGHYFAATNFERMRTEVYCCDSYDPAHEYAMTNVNDPKDHRDVSCRALGRTWIEAEDRGDHWWVPGAHARIEKWALADSGRPADLGLQR